MKTRTRILRSCAVLVALGLVATACGSDDDSDSGSAATAAPDAPLHPRVDRTRGIDAPGATAAPAGGGDVGVSLILKNLSNAFFVSMADSAQAEADAIGVSLTVAAGQEDGDTQSQIDAVEAAVARGDKGILITPSGDAVIPSLDAARAAGLFVIALDTPPNPATAVDITFATDNYKAGQLIGQWTAGQLAGEKATIAMLDLFNDQVVSVDTRRDQGFLNGMGIVDEFDASGNGKEPPSGSYSGGDYEIVCHEPTNGAVDGGKTAMETCLAANSDINVVYTINEPAAQGAYDALTAAGKGDGVLIVSVDGGCSPGLRAGRVRSHRRHVAAVPGQDGHARHAGDQDPRRRWSGPSRDPWSRLLRHRCRIGDRSAGRRCREHLGRRGPGDLLGLIPG